MPVSRRGLRPLPFRPSPRACLPVILTAKMAVLLFQRALIRRRRVDPPTGCGSIGRAKSIGEYTQNCTHNRKNRASHRKFLPQRSLRYGSACYPHIPNRPGCCQRITQASPIYRVESTSSPRNEVPRERHGPGDSKDCRHEPSGLDRGLARVAMHVQTRLHAGVLALRQPGSIASHLPCREPAHRGRDWEGPGLRRGLRFPARRDSPAAGNGQQATGNGQRATGNRQEGSRFPGAPGFAVRSQLSAFSSQFSVFSFQLSAFIPSWFPRLVCRRRRCRADPPVRAWRACPR